MAGNNIPQSSRKLTEALASNLLDTGADVLHLEIVRCKRGLLCAGFSMEEDGLEDSEQQ